MSAEARNLELPECKPAIESIRGRWESKVSPQRRHNILQTRLGMLLTQWAGERGEVGSEWRFYLAPAGEEPSSLVPDVAYYSFERLPRTLGELREKTALAPDIAVEILSPGDRPEVLTEKVALYLTNGTRSVLVVDPLARSVDVYEENATHRVVEPESATLRSYPDLRIETPPLFENL